ncbi:FAD/NAD(P)-binding domain-containing protein [Lophiostoma macrostomum CBS 122681]|uniref:FAD/NAD(P)-binding domain-containing protein n=1 Tax=Lophiostoma macrostomum CBS 122681 TaxID=1314788 RepID=A0A6A6SUX3_9PLEO|nr:FAD/NAD(P)-binding domain-containing protein [Lophiostoma macrostomum CBS 122681]
MSQPLKIVIVGAGIGGLACAIASRRQGFDVLVLERAEKLTPLGAGIQIPPNASRIWAQYSLLDELKKYSVISKATELRRWKDGELLCSRSVGEEMDERWPWLVIHRADYQQVLVEEAKRLGVIIRLNAGVMDVQHERDMGAKVVLRDGEVVAADVVIGADGLWSTLRGLILGHASPPQETGDLAYRGTFSRSALLSLDDPAVDELCEKSVVTVWIGPESHAVFYPVRCGNEFNLVMTRPDDLPPDVKTQEGDLEEMKAVFEGWDPVLTKVLTAFPHVLKWKMMHHDELESWTKNSVALLGDASHPSLPYQAQGAAMAVEDGAIIATLLGLQQTHLHQDHPRNPPSCSQPTIPQTLKLYERLQKTRTTTLHLGSISNQHMYHLADGPEQEERDRVLRSARWEERPMGEDEDEEERFIWIDVRYQKAMLGRDAIGCAIRAWEEFIKTTSEQPYHVKVDQVMQAEAAERPEKI